MICSLLIQNFFHIKRLHLQDLLSVVYIYGSNGVGKTTVLDSIFLFKKKRLLLSKRNVSGCISNFCVQHNDQCMCVRCIDHNQLCFDASFNHKKRKMIFYKNRKILPSGLSSLLPILYLTVSDFLVFTYNCNKAERRIFFSRIFVLFDSKYSALIREYQSLCSRRISVLKNGNYSEMWISSLEESIASIALHIYSIRYNVISRINHSLPVAEDGPLSVHCEEKDGNFYKGIESEKQNLIEKLVLSRIKDARVSYTTFGPNTSFFYIKSRNCDKKLYLSLGQQKSFILDIFLTCGKLLSKMDVSPVLLIDEFFVYCDKKSRERILLSLEDIKYQLWITGLKRDDFSTSSKDFSLVDLDFLLSK